MTNHLRIALLASVAFAAPVAAQETSPDADVRSVTDDVITVTARLREETVQDIGASVAGISGAEIRERGIQDIEDLARSIAGMANVKTRQNSNDIAIRGVRSAGSGYETSTVFSVFVDDVSVTGAGNLRDFSSVDLNRIEVIRGPQPTLFGEGAVGVGAAAGFIWEELAVGAVRHVADGGVDAAAS